MKLLWGLLLIFAFGSCKSNTDNQSKNQSKETEPKISVYNFDEFEQFLHQEDDKLHVVNFWATWCKPCIEEMPYFFKLSKENDINLVLVSLDLPAMKDTQLKPFLEKNNIYENIILLDDPNSNVWIPKVHKDWSGAIPATKIYNKDKSKFIARPFKSYEELLNEVEQMM